MTAKTQQRRFLNQVRLRTLSDTVPESNTLNSSVINWTDSIDGGYLPNWKQRIKSHVNATTNLTVDVRSIVGPGLTGRVRYNGTANKPNTWVVKDVIDSFGDAVAFAPHLGDLTLARNDALIRFYQKARDAQVAFQGGVGLGELRETLSMLMHPGKSLKRGLQAYLFALRNRSKRIMRRRASRSERSSALASMISETWLEYKFGWAPFISDISDAADLLRNKGVANFTGYQFVIGSGETRKGSDTVTHQLVNSYIGFWNNEKLDSRRSSKYYGVVYASPRGGVSFTNTGLGFDNFLPTIWELIPYSFIVDYFSNIGATIDAWSYCASNIRWMSRTDKSVASKLNTYVASDYARSVLGDRFVECYVAGSNYSESVLIVRSPMTATFPRPTVTFRLPGFGTKWCNMAALAISSKSLSTSFRK